MQSISKYLLADTLNQLTESQLMAAPIEKSLVVKTVTINTKKGKGW